ncbi:hypothetical protein CNR22_24255 [Sphingobacteriaceae bacterium]|nr:hypothetical protein CNR22_24255 [Sphingobacteriaceae bacterium]
MFENSTYTKKCYLLFGGLFLFFVLGYRMSFSDTFSLVDEIAAKEKKLSWLKDKERELPALKSKMEEFERAYAKGDSTAVRDKLTAYISDFAEKNSCLVTEIPLNSSFKNDNLNVQTNTFTIKGNFYSLLSLLHKMENDYKYVSKIMSARFFSVKDLQTKRKNLYLTLITQSFEQKK